MKTNRQTPNFTFLSAQLKMASNLRSEPFLRPCPRCCRPTASRSTQSPKTLKS